MLSEKTILPTLKPFYFLFFYFFGGIQIYITKLNNLILFMNSIIYIKVKGNYFGQALFALS